MEYTPVNSSNIAEVGYDADSQTLGMKFHSGTTYHYAEVPKEKHDELLTAESPGAVFAREIKGKYEARKVE